MNRDTQEILMFLKRNPQLAREVSHNLSSNSIRQAQNIYEAMNKPSWVTSIEWFIECAVDAVYEWRSYDAWLQE